VCTYTAQAMSREVMVRMKSGGLLVWKAARLEIDIPYLRVLFNVLLTRANGPVHCTPLISGSWWSAR
jgi:hypothetical protein